MSPLSITEFFDELERFAGHPVYRHINVIYDVIKQKKNPIGEKNNMSVEEIRYNKGNDSGNSLSLYVKHIKDLYVIDFDTKDLQNCELKHFLDSRKNLFVETRKGFHYYIFIKDMINFTNQQKIYKDETIEVDLIKTNNIWETKSREVHGVFANINSFDWSELSQFFNVKKMNDEKKKKTQVKDFVPSFEIEEVKNDFEPMTQDEFEKIKTAVSFLDKKRADDYKMWLEVGMALYNEGNDMQGRMCEVWDTFSKKSDKYSGMMSVFQKYQTFKGKQGGLTVKSIFHWLKEDNPEEFRKLCVPQNKYAEWYFKGPSKFMEMMNKELFYYATTGLYYYKIKENYVNMNKKHIARDYYEKFIFTVKDKENEKKIIKINPFDFWCQNIDRRDILKIVMKPNQETGDEVYNLWSGYDYQNTGDYDQSKIQYFLDHIKNILANGDEDIYEYLLNWFAHIIQKPEKKTQVCVVLKSKEGVGKTIIIDKIMEILGSSYCQTILKMNDALGRFNKILEKKILVNFNETNWGGDKKMAGTFKSLITDSKITIEGKGVESYETDNLINCIITTNEEWIVQVSGDDRRFYLIECNEQKLNREGISKILNTPLQDLANFFYNRDITEFDPTQIKITKMKQDQIIMNYNSIEVFFHNIYEEEISLASHRLDEGEFDEDGKLTMFKQSVYELYEENTKGEHNGIKNNVQFWKKVRQIFPSVEFIKAQKNSRPKVQFQSLNKLKEEFRNYSKM